MLSCLVGSPNSLCATGRICAVIGYRDVHVVEAAISRHKGKNHRGKFASIVGGACGLHPRQKKSSSCLAGGVPNRLCIVLQVYQTDPSTKNVSVMMCFFGEVRCRTVSLIHFAAGSGPLIAVTSKTGVALSCCSAKPRPLPLLAFAPVRVYAHNFGQKVV